MKNIFTTRPLRKPASGHVSKRALSHFRAVPHSDYPPAPFPMCFTVEAMNTILATVGAYPPETGAKIFSRVEKMGVETVEFDKQGSQAGNRIVYRPDTLWGHKRLEYHMNQPEMRLWTGDIHSHPAGMGTPSFKSGPGLGDLGYVEEVFEQNEMMEYFLLPILTETGTDRPLIHPWVCQRGNPVRLMVARVCVYYDDSNFAKRIFNPVWELQQEETLRETEELPEVRGVTESPGMDNKPEATIPYAIADTTEETPLCTFQTDDMPNKNSCETKNPPSAGVTWNLNALQHKITEHPQIIKHKIKLTICMDYGDMVIDALCDIEQPQKAPELFLTRQGIRCSIIQKEWERFAGTFPEEHLLRYCNEYVARLRDEAGQHPETVGPQEKASADKTAGDISIKGIQE